MTIPFAQEHECDLFLMTSHAGYFANQSLRNFGIHGSTNCDGWGIGGYIDSMANVVRSSSRAVKDNSIADDFRIAMECINSPIILGHLRKTSVGTRISENNHPFKLHFLDYDWMLIHNGTAKNHNQLVRKKNIILSESNCDSARVFEFLRIQILEYYLSSYKKGLIEAVRKAYTNLLNKDPDGKYNIILSNGYISFVFIHWRPFYMLNREKDTGNTAIISTLKFSDDEEWLELKKIPTKIAKMLVFSGQTLIFNGDVPK